MENCLFSSVILVYLLTTHLALKPSSFQRELVGYQKVVYEKIKQERLTLFSVGIMFGAIVAVLVNSMYTNKYPRCTIFAITYIFAVFFYTVSPKSTYMIYHLDNEQIRVWKNVYKRMKTVNAMFFTLALTTLVIRM